MNRIISMLALCLSCFASADQLILPPPDGSINALTAFYGSTGGPSWSRNSNWLIIDPLDPYSVCKWQGVYCEEDRSRDDEGNLTIQLNVYRLFMPDNNLIGPFPGMLAALPKLRIVEMENNQLSGNIPKEIAGFTSLGILNVGHNQLTGPLPREYFTMLQRNATTPFSLGNFSLVKNQGLKSPLGDWYVTEFPKLAALHQAYFDDAGSPYDVILNGPFGSESCFLAEREIATLFAGQPWKIKSCNSENVGCPEGNTGPSCLVGNPMNMRSGVKQQAAIDYSGAGPFPLKITRSYNSKSRRWKFNSFDAFLYDYGDDSHKGVTLGNGRSYFFRKTTPDSWTATKSANESAAYEGYRLQQLSGGIRFLKPAGDSLDFDAAGNLQTINSADGHSLQISKSDNVLTVSDEFGQHISINYDSANKNRPASLTTPQGTISYGYDEFGNLASVTYPGDKTKLYHYDEIDFTAQISQGLLTGITNENGQRYATWHYDSHDRVYKSVHGEDADVTEIEYLPDDNGRKVRQEHMPLGGSKRYYFDAEYGTRAELIEHFDNKGGLVGSESFAYNGFGHLSTHTDIKGKVTQYNRYTDGREDNRIEAVGTPQARTVTTSYTGLSNLPATITTPELKTELSYNAQNQILSRKLTDQYTSEIRTTTYGYNAAGLLISIDGPRTDIADITTYAYDEQGRRIKTTNALGHTIQVLAFNASGKPTQIKDANDVVTNLAYNSRNLAIIATTNGLTTTIDYNDSSKQTKMTLPTGQVINYEYDAAQRLTSVVDMLGNRIDYTLDGAGNRTRTAIKDPQGILHYTQQQAFDAFNQLATVESGEGNQQGFRYNAANELISQTDALKFATTHSYDAAGNLTTSKDAAGNITQYGYDGARRNTHIVDAEGKITVNQYNGFGELISKISADTGLTSYQYDKAGNLIQKGKLDITRYQYDALNRLIFQSAHNATYTYDQGSYAVGRLSSVSNPSSSEQLSYDANGNITTHSQTIANAQFTTEYHYDSKNRLVGMTYPGGRSISLSRNTLDQITAIHSNEQTLVENVQYLPFGPVKSATYGNGLQLVKTFDLDYRPIKLLTTSIEDKTLNYSARNNITNIDDILGISQNYSYSPMQRLISANESTFGYDKIGNRTSKNTDVYSYADASHHLLSAGDIAYQYDAVGQVIQKGDMTFAYNTAGQMANVIFNRQAVDYRYNHRNQRVMKVSSGNSTRYVYDLTGKLIAEIGTDNNVEVEYIYLNNMLLTVIYKDASTDQTSDKIKIDDKQAQADGKWKPKTTQQAFKGGHQVAKGDSGATMTWQQTVAAGTYKVHARWKANKNRSKTASYHVNGQVITMDQTVSGKKWRLLTKVVVEENGQITVVLKDTGGKVSADGIRIKRVKNARLASSESQIYFTHTNHLGTPTKLTNADGAVVWQAEYSPFGLANINNDVNGDGNAITFNLRLPGQYFDAETGLHYNWHRYYDPQIGRYLQPDPIGLIDGPSLYGYAQQNPVNNFDPTGQSTLAMGGRMMLVPIPGARLVGGVLLVAGAIVYFSDDIAAQFKDRNSIEDVTDELNKEENLSQTLPWPVKNKGKWTCICRANKNGRSTKNCADTFSKEFAFGWGVGPTMLAAYQQAERMAKSLLGAASVHHVQCKCTDPKGRRVNRGSN
jgi:RHS repeat-associated protein